MLNRLKSLSVASVVCFGCLGWLSAPSWADQSVLPPDQLSAQVPSPQAKPIPANVDWAWWIALGLLSVSGGGIALYSIRQSNIRQSAQLRTATSAQTLSVQTSDGANPEPSIHSSSHLTKADVGSDLSLPQPNADFVSLAVNSTETSAETSAVDAAITPTTRLAKVDIVEAMIADLQNPDPAKRRKAIWELGQQGDSRAMQPLVNLLIDADSQQRSLILAALTEISTRTLKPLNRALMLSLQDQSSEVRKNAIRDATRIYDLILQLSQLVQYATSDTDAEVQETAHWALGQLNRLRSAPAESAAPIDSYRSPEAENRLPER
jgi:hypothetical protein